jgi:hypothetical protein
LGKAAFELFNKDRGIIHPPPPVLVQQTVELFQPIGLPGQAGLLCRERLGFFRVESGDSLQYFVDG